MQFGNSARGYDDVGGTGWVLHARSNISRQRTAVECASSVTARAIHDPVQNIIIIL